MMRTKAKLVLASCGVTMMVAVGISIAGLYTYHHDASLRGHQVTGLAPLTIGTLPDQRLLGVADLPVRLQVPCLETCSGVPNKIVANVAHDDAVPQTTVFNLPNKNGAHDNGHSPLDDPTKVLMSMGPSNPAVLRGTPAFLR